MNKIAAACALVLGTALLTSATSPPEASPKDRLLAPGTFKLAGRYVRCGRASTLISHTFWDYGGAKKGVIILNPTKLEGLSDTIRLFVYAHECGHQIYGPPETRADCYAVERGKREGWLTQAGVDEICTFLKPYPGDWLHPPGPKRCEIMQKCFAKAKPRRAQN